ncbi:hypothetical protein VIGAN_02058900, partial [Vigna angularis var. angularis]
MVLKSATSTSACSEIGTTPLEFSMVINHFFLNDEWCFVLEDFIYSVDKSHITLCSCFLLLLVSPFATAFALEMFEDTDDDLCFLFFGQIN